MGEGGLVGVSWWRRLELPVTRTAVDDVGEPLFFSSSLSLRCARTGYLYSTPARESIHSWRIPLRAFAVHY
jgi:hypothetical protein